MSSLVIWGAGGHGKAVLDVASSLYSDIAFFDDSEGPSTLLGRRVFRDVVALRGQPRPPEHFVAAVGDNMARARCFERAIELGLKPAVLVHGSAVVSTWANVGPGTVVLPKAVVNTQATVGINCIVNTAAVIEHDCQVGDHVHLSPAVVAGGGAVVEDYVHIGIGGILLPLSRVGRGAVVGAGAVVLDAVAAATVVAGVPARCIRSK